MVMGRTARPLAGESDARTSLRHSSGAPRRRPSASVTSASTEIRIECHTDFADAIETQLSDGLALPWPGLLLHRCRFASLTQLPLLSSGNHGRLSAAFRAAVRLLSARIEPTWHS
jgi:hypothetical protein